MPTKKTKKKTTPAVKHAAQELSYYSKKGKGACKGLCSHEARILAKSKKKKKK